MKSVAIQKLRSRLSLLLFASAACTEGPSEPPVATTMAAKSETSISAVAGTSVSPTPSVVVLDQNGEPFSGATVTFSVVSGGGSVIGPTLVTDASGTATVGGWTLGNTVGPNVLSATSGTLTVNFNATGTVGPTALLTISSGNNQTAIAGSAVAIPPAVLVQDGNGNPKPGVTVTFTIGTGGGSVAGGTAVSDAAGIAKVTTWTLGTVVGPNTLITSAAGVSPVTFSATGAVGAAASLTVSSGNNQTAVTRSTVAVAPAVLVNDANGNAKAGVTVTFTIGSGGGSLAGGTATSDAAGIARVGSWTLGSVVGSNTLIASAAGVASVTFSATGVVGATALLTITGGNNQTAVAGSAVAVPLAVRAEDANGNVKSGVTVTFTVGSGGGALTGGSATSDAAGIARVGSWTLGLTGTNTLVASSAGAPSVTFSATATSKCGVLTSHTLGSTTSGTLETNDCQFPSDGSFVDFFSIALPQANAFLFRQSAAFDTFLQLSLPDGTLIASNDDESLTSSNSTIKALLPSGTYSLGAGSFAGGVTGGYNLTSQTTSPDNAACQVVFVTKNVATTQNIAADCLWQGESPAVPIYADVFYIFLHVGESITLNMSSSNVNSYLELRNELFRLNGTLVAQNDNRDGTTNDSRITFTATAEDYYAIVARTSVGAQTGAYTLTIQ